jgi:proline iminopeptidase
MPPTMTSTEGRFATRDGARLYYQKAGEGPPSLVIPNGIVYGRDFTRLAERRPVLSYDVRNRGQSDEVLDPARLERGIGNDVEDLEDLRQHFDIPAMDMLGHSYVGMMVILYAARYPESVGRIVQIGASPPQAAKAYPPALTARDETFATVMRVVAALQANPDPADPEERCRRFWTALAPLYVVDPARAHRVVGWGRCDLPNERRAFAYLSRYVFPSMQALAVDAGTVATVRGPVLLVHGRRDRSAPYGGARDWAGMLPDARLLTVDDAAHAPWIEAPDLVFGAIDTFLDGRWPDAATRIIRVPA